MLIKFKLMMHKDENLAIVREIAFKDDDGRFEYMYNMNTGEDPNETRRYILNENKEFNKIIKKIEEKFNVKKLTNKQLEKVGENNATYDRRYGAVVFKGDDPVNRMGGTGGYNLAVHEIEI